MYKFYKKFFILTKIFFTVFIQNIMTNNVSFTSRFNFVTAQEFDKFRRGAYIDFKADGDLSFLDLKKIRELERELGSKIDHPRVDVVKADEFNTETVRTCTAGGVVDTKNGEAAGFHGYDSLFNLEHVDDFLDNLFWRVKNPDRAFLIGSKTLRGSVYSCPFFQKLYEGLKERVPNITVIREHVLPYSETDFHYGVKNDTWTIHSMYKPLTDYREYDIKSREELDKCFKEIRLANGDILTFGEK